MHVSSRHATPTIDVAVAILRDSRGRVLVAQRRPGQLSAGYWELPGGKVDPGETASEAAAREAAEEVGVIIQSLRPYTVYEHRFPLRRLRLHFFMATRWDGQPHGREGQSIAWVEPHRPSVAPVLPSNHRALALLALPGDGLALASHACRGQGWHTTGQGPSLLVMRTRRESRAMVAHRLRQTVGARDGSAAALWIEDDADLAVGLGVGLYSTTPALRWPTRPDVGLWAVCCRDRVQVKDFARVGADVAVVPAGPASTDIATEAARLFAEVYLESGPAQAAATREQAAQLGLRGVIVREPCACPVRAG